MKKLQGIGWTTGLTLATLIVTSACNMDAVKGPKDKADGATEATYLSNFAGRGELCGTYVSFNGYVGDATSELGRPSSLMVQLGVCGKSNGDNEWKALAITHSSAKVDVTRGSTEGSSDVFVDDKGVFVRRPDGKKTKIGSAQTVSRGYKLDLETGVKVQVMVDGEPYSLETSKASGAKAIRVTLPD